jgi:4-amino-4-deoxy-L-arabinose transferase-like glycosyltransferase
MDERAATPEASPAKQNSRQSVVSTGLAVLLACAVLLPLLGHKLLTDWDEGIYAEVAREMLGRGWMVPTWNFQPWFEKPPLMFWVTAVFFKLFGVHEFWARAGSALSGVAIVGVLHGWLMRRGDRLAAWLSTLILLSTLGFLHVCRMGELDVLLSLGCSVALCGLAEVSESKAGGWYWFWGGFAIALMTKSAASVTLALAVVVVAVLGRWGLQYFGRQFWLGLAVFLLAVLPWHVAMWERFGSAFLAEYLGFHTLTRATEQIEGHTTHWWYYLWVLLVSAAPFVLLFPAAIVKALRRVDLRAWAVFALVVVGFFSVVQTRLPHYIAPAYPALALLTAVYAADWLREFERKLKQRWGARAFWMRVAVAAIAVWGLGAFATSVPRKESILLLQNAFRHPQPAGPVLVWREGDTRSIATSIFYTHRPVEQVQLEPSPASAPRDKYYFNPVALGEMVTAEPRVILLDKRLLSRVPQGMVYAPIVSGATMEVGTIRRAK